MRGPIDFIVVGFEGNKLDGSVLSALADALDSGVIGLIALSVIVKDQQGTVATLDMTELEGDYVMKFKEYIDPDAAATALDEEDVDEVARLLENDTAAGLLVIEHLWAKPLKRAIIDANGMLIADGRIHPDTAEDLET